MKTMDHVKKRIIISMLSILLLIITLFGITYAYFTTKVKGNDKESISVKSGKLALEYGDGNGVITAEKIIPGTVLDTKTFSVKNTGTHVVENYGVVVQNVINNLENYEDLTYILTCKSFKSIDYEEFGEDATETGMCNGSEGAFPTKDDKIVSNAIEKDMTHYYEITVTFKETNKDQSVDMKKKIEAKINIIDNATNARRVLVYGNSIQNSIPSPEAPIEIKSVGDKTKNLFDATKIKNTNIEVLENGKKIIMPIGTSGNGYTSTNTTLKELCPDLKVGDTVILNFETTSPSRTIIYSSVIGSWRIGTSQTITQEMLDSKIVLYGNNYSEGETEQVIITNLQIEYGETVSDYEHYGKHKIPIKVRGKNLFDLNNYTITGNPTVEIINGHIKARVDFSNRFTYKVTGLDPTKQYTFSFKKSEESKMFFYVHDKRGNWVGETKGTPVTVTPTAEGNLSFVFASGDNNQWFNYEIWDLQLEEGNVATIYEPYVVPINTNIYLDEPLRKVGENADYIDFEKDKIYRHIEKIDNLSKYGWGISSQYFQVNNILAANLTSRNKSLSSHFSYGVYTDRNSFWIDSTGKGLRFSHKDYNEVNLFKEWLEHQGVYVLYPLSNPIEESIDLPTIPKFKGTTVVEIDTEVKPSKIEIRY